MLTHLLRYFPLKARTPCGAKGEKDQVSKHRKARSEATSKKESQEKEESHQLHLFLSFASGFPNPCRRYLLQE